MKSIKVKLDEPFQITVVDESGNEYFSDEYEFDSSTLITHERGGSAELNINPIALRGLKKTKYDLRE